MTHPIEVLLVEDNPGEVRLTREALKESYVDTHLNIAGNGVEALAMLHNKNVPRPDLVLLDLNLPRMNGLELLRNIKADERFRAIPVVVLTTSDNEEQVRRAYALHANCYIIKPVDMDRFVRILHMIKEFWFTTVRLPRKS